MCRREQLQLHVVIAPDSADTAPEQDESKIEEISAARHMALVAFSCPTLPP